MESIEIIKIEVLTSNELSVTPIINWDTSPQYGTHTLAKRFLHI